MTAASRVGRVYRTELIRADIARLVEVDLGHAPAGGPACWALWIDAATVACTDEPMTDEQAQHWARRMLGEHVTFEPGHRDGGYWVATPTHSLDPAATPPAAPRGCSSGTTAAHPRPGPSAKNAHRAGTPNHCQSTQEVTIMGQPTATGGVPVHPDHVKTRYALTDAGHVVLTPVGDPPPVLVLSCTACEHAYEASLHDVAHRPARLLELRWLDVPRGADRPPGRRGCPVSGPEHYLEAERLLQQMSWEADNGQTYYTEESGPDLAADQVHATLALAAATAYPAVRDHWAANDSGTPRDWAQVAS